jgi:hypothetical protein
VQLVPVSSVRAAAPGEDVNAAGRMLGDDGLVLCNIVCMYVCIVI